MSDDGWNLAEVWERIAAEIPDAPAQRQADRTISWSELDRRANGVARILLGADGAAEQDKVAQYLHNCPEYLESVFAAFKAGMAVVNTNYRYAADELVYLWDNADVTTVVFHDAFTERCDEVRARVPRITTWLWVADGSEEGAGSCPEWATPYEAAAETGDAEAVRGPWGRSGDHLVLLYTGGTTGMPKGVMWRQDDLFGVLDANNRQRLPPEQDLDAATSRIDGPGPRNMPSAPLMHGTGLFNAISNTIIGGSITSMVGRSFSAEEFLDTVQRERINSTSIVGDAFAKPILRALDAEPDRWDISSLRVIVSSGVMWSKETKDGLLRHNERLIMVDALGSSEAIGMATNTTTSSSGGGTARFVLGPDTRVITDDGRDVVAGSDELGRVALRGRTPIGYYKDEAKSAETFVTIDGHRYSIPGDYATVDADGTVNLKGRGSQCINTGGEKVYPEEVEECLKLHPSVADAAVVGLPDERWGQAINALVELGPGERLDVEGLREHVKSHLAAYKAPKRIVEIASVGRAANGKLDYASLTAIAGAEPG
ncbi:AMP-binding protein [Ilumatobacter sp.]|uniref:AMP-binding protein n=1 Tax=Ilumatobacter sp. TaxID=1967498 RepID=UPI003B52A33B